jgi:hypothetical protein
LLLFLLCIRVSEWLGAVLKAAFLCHFRDVWKPFFAIMTRVPSNTGGGLGWAVIGEMSLVYITCGFLWIAIFHPVLRDSEYQKIRGDAERNETFAAF